jgi:ABC-type Fe3+/spermidine/putrescine transport system ATPase subunit
MKTTVLALRRARRISCVTINIVMPPPVSEHRFGGKAMEQAVAVPDPAQVSIAVAIEIVGMHKWFGDFHVVRDINISTRLGEGIVICGPSGSGKASMIRCIKRLGGAPAGKSHRRWLELTGDLDRIDEVQRDVGMVFRHFNLLPHLTVLENCTLAPIWVLRMHKSRPKRSRCTTSRASRFPNSRRSILASSAAASSSASPSPEHFSRRSVTLAGVLALIAPYGRLSGLPRESAASAAVDIATPAHVDFRTSSDRVGVDGAARHTPSAGIQNCWHPKIPPSNWRSTLAMARLNRERFYAITYRYRRLLPC